MSQSSSYKVRATLTSKGQITLPVELRRRWDLKTGDELDFALDGDNRVVVRKLVRAAFDDGGEGGRR
jgi:AbrB family looped-hinge helix DNA binding protein